MENKTPRTDAEFKLEAFFDGSGIVETVSVEFARELETELAEARAEIAELKKGAESDTKTILRQANSIRTIGEELADKDRQLAEALDASTAKAKFINKQTLELAGLRADIERLNKGIKIVQSAFKNYKNADAIIARTTLKKAQILSASCDPDAVDSERAANEILTTEIEHKNKMIEQMREALKGASKHFDRNYWNVKNDPDFEDLNEIWQNIEAALEAERGEK